MSSTGSGAHLTTTGDIASITRVIATHAVVTPVRQEAQEQSPTLKHANLTPPNEGEDGKQRTDEH